MLWPNGRTKAFTLSYDDGIQQDQRLLELLNRFQIKGTFNLNGGLLGQEGTVSAGKRNVSHHKIPASEIPALYAGHEVAVHGYYHSCMYAMDLARCTREILSCRLSLEEILKQPLTGFAYAFGIWNPTILEALKACGITYARTIKSTYRFEIPEDFLLWNPTCHHDDERLFELAEQFLSDAPIFSFFGPAKLFYIWGHSYEFDQNNNWNHMETFLQKMSGQKDVWYATNREIRQYADAYSRLIFSADGSVVNNPSALSVWLGGMFTNDSVEVKPGIVTTLLPPVCM